jgi:CarboxypepD_reg-like domain
VLLLTTMREFMIASLCLVSLRPLSWAQISSPPTLVGVVLSESSREAVVGAVVAMPHLNRTVLTDADGVFRLTGLPLGRQTVTVRRLGYVAVTSDIDFLDADTVRKLFVLPDVVRLDSVVVSAPASDIPGFDERRARHMGHYISRQELERATSKRMADVLSELPGLRVIRGSRPIEAYAMSGRGKISILAANPECYVQVYIDGAAAFTAPPQPAVQRQHSRPK